MRKTDISLVDQAVAVHRDKLDQRVVRAGWGSTLRMILLRIGSAYADRISKPAGVRTGHPMMWKRRTVHWLIGAGTAALATALSAVCDLAAAFVRLVLIPRPLQGRCCPAGVFVWVGR
jgi:hypothetical protein